jgi:hypothetical protein
VKTPRTPTDEQTRNKMTWGPGDVEWVRNPPTRTKKTAAQRLADRIRRGRDDQQRR